VGNWVDCRMPQSHVEVGEGDEGSSGGYKSLQNFVLKVIFS